MARVWLKQAGNRTVTKSGLNGHQLTHAVGGHVSSTPSRYHLPPFHHEVLIRQLGREVVVLLHKHDRHLSAAGQQADHAADVLDDRRLDAFGRLVEQQQRRARRQRAGVRELLLLVSCPADT